MPEDRSGICRTAGPPSLLGPRRRDVEGAGGATTSGGWRCLRRWSQTKRWHGSGDDGPTREPARATEGTCPAAAPRLAGPTGGWVAAARGHGRRQPTGRHAAFATRCPRDGHTPLSVMMAWGDLICMQGTICIVSCLPGSISNRGIEPGQRFPPF